MKVFRFMSMREFDKMNAYCPITGKKSFAARTKSTGVCFMSEEDYQPNYAYAFLKGIVSADIVVEFEVDPSELTESWGIYADPLGDYFDTIEAREYCAPSYDRERFVPVRYGIPRLYNRGIDWYTFN